jgi:hypothetical protein
LGHQPFSFLAAQVVDVAVAIGVDDHFKSNLLPAKAERGNVGVRIGFQPCVKVRKSL